MSRLVRLALCVSVFSVVVALGRIGPAAAEVDVLAPACKVPRPSDRMTVQFAADTSVRDLANWLASFTCKPVVFTAEVAAMAAKVNVIAPSPLTSKQARQLFVTTVEALGLVVEDKAGTVLIKPGRALKASCAALTTAGPSRDVVAELGDPFDSPSGAPQPDPPGVTAAELDAGIKRIDETHVEVQRALVDQLVANPMALAKGARIVPSMKNGQPIGFKLYAVRPGSVIARLGFLNGDTVERINGRDVSTADKAFEVYATVRTARRFELALVRRGKPVTLVITIK